MKALVAIGGLIAVVSLAAPTIAFGAGPHVLLVGPSGTRGATYTSIQDAVNHAHQGDWVLVAPGVYHEKGSNSLDTAAGVLITTPGIHLRGMDRNKVVIDGTNPKGTLPAGSPTCSSALAKQDYGPIDPSSHKPVGRNGVEVHGVDAAGHRFLADNVSIENLTVCNYLSSASGANGNEIWWNGGDGSGHIGMRGFSGRYLSASSTFYKDSKSAMGKYGIFTSNEGGPGVIDNTYASNMGDSAYYIGACPDCNVVLSHPHAVNSALGYSGTNGSGRVLIELGEWDHNKAGIVPNTLNNDDWPSPQTGACPPGVKPPTLPKVTVHNCLVIYANSVHDNNNPNTPSFGIAGAAPVGAGIELSGTQHDSVVANTVTQQDSWGIVPHDFPDTETPPPAAVRAGMACHGGTQSSAVCLYTSKSNEVIKNTLGNNGGNGNPSNGDLGNEGTATAGSFNCFQGNVRTPDDPGSVTTWPAGLQTTGCPTGAPGDNQVLAAQLICASSAVAQCPQAPEAHYPQRDLTKCSLYAPGSVATGDPKTGACLLRMPKQGTMPNPCAGVPSNAFCAHQGTTAAEPFSGVGSSPLGALFSALLGGAGTLSLAPPRFRRSRGQRPIRPSALS